MVLCWLICFKIKHAMTWWEGIVRSQNTPLKIRNIPMRPPKGTTCIHVLVRVNPKYILSFNCIIKIESLWFSCSTYCGVATLKQCMHVLTFFSESHLKKILLFFTINCISVELFLNHLELVMHFSKYWLCRKFIYSLQLIWYKLTNQMISALIRIKMKRSSTAFLKAQFW